VRDDQRGPTTQNPAQSLLDKQFGARIHRGGGLIEDEDRRITDYRTREGDQLSLPGRKGPPTFADYGFEPLWERFDERERACDRRREGYPFVARLQVAVSDVVRDGAGEQERLLQHDAEVPAQGRDGDSANVMPVDSNGATRGLVEAWHQIDDARLPRTGFADYGDSFTCPDFEIDAGKDLRAREVGEAYRLQGDIALYRAQLDRVRAIDDGGLRVDEMKHALGACQCGLCLRVQR